MIPYADHPGRNFVRSVSVSLILYQLMKQKAIGKIHENVKTKGENAEDRKESDENGSVFPVNRRDVKSRQNHKQNTRGKISAAGIC